MYAIGTVMAQNCFIKENISLKGSLLKLKAIRFSFKANIITTEISTPDILYNIVSRNTDISRRDVYCRGPLLNAVQSAGVFKNQKIFVNKKMKFHCEDVLSNFYNLEKNYGGRRPAQEALKIFIEENFEDAQEFEHSLPPDWKKKPKIVEGLTDERLKSWSSELNGIWKTLGRRISDEVKNHPEAYSIISVPNSFILPATKSMELSYWDAYWIIKGLLICEMYISVKDMIENYIHLIKEYGYIPLSNRVYYEERSGMPMLGMMMEAYLEFTQDFNFIAENLETLEKEIHFWREKRTIQLQKNSIEYQVFHYSVNSEGPRPEDYLTDIFSGTLAITTHELQDYFKSIKAASESGWAFSTRWFVFHGFNLGTRSNTLTPSIIPVDLNAVMQKNYSLLSNWYEQVGNRKKRREYWLKSEELIFAIEKIMWNENSGIWQDYDYVNDRSRNYFYLSNFTPLWTKSHRKDPKQLTEVILKYLNKYNMDHYEGGIPSSTEYSDELWDFPNVWPPLQVIFIQGLDRIGTSTASELAFHFADKFINAAYKGYEENGAMFAAYDCLIPGRFGIGLTSIEFDNTGDGYGWTNGAIFEFIKRWGNEIKLK